MTKKKAETAVVKKKERNITDVVLGRITDMTSKQELFMPADYSPENALKSAWLKLQATEDRNKKKALEVCTPESVSNALLDMVVQGLSPAKNQCYFIVYGNELTLQRSYMGTVAVARRFSDVTDVLANVIYEGDEFKYKIDPMTGLKQITLHEQDFMNIDVNKIKGAYAIVHRENEEPYVEIMTMEQIRKSWNQGATKGKSPAHTNFAEEMAKKTVINRACKMFVNTSDDSAVLVDAFNRTTENEHRREDYSKKYSPDQVIEVEAEERAAAVDAIFGAVPSNPQPEPEPEEQEPKESDANELTPEEKAYIEAMEAAEAGD